MVVRIVQTFSTFSHAHANQRTENMFQFLIFNILPKTNRRIPAPTKEHIEEEDKAKKKEMQRKDLFRSFDERLESHISQLTSSIPIIHEFTLQTLLVCRSVRAPNFYI